MNSSPDPLTRTATEADAEPILDARTRLRLGRQLQALYEPMLDEVLDPRLAELMAQLEVDRGQWQQG
ncbi:hypothetical protein BV511_10330 [Methylorubrum extorquens]|nr:hypothetical protein BV511_10330 [Methylorubrum extorquens]